MNVYIVKLENFEGIADWHTGYQSIWQNQEMALRQLSKLNDVFKESEIKYTIETRYINLETKYPGSKSLSAEKIYLPVMKTDI